MNPIEQQARAVSDAFAKAVSAAGNEIKGWNYVLLAWPTDETMPGGVIRMSNIPVQDVLREMKPVMQHLEAYDEELAAAAQADPEAVESKGVFNLQQGAPRKKKRTGKPNEHNIITKIQLDIGAAHGCQYPDCTHESHGKEEVFLHGTCHPRATVDVSYERGSGLLRVECAECRTGIVYVKVA